MGLDQQGAESYLCFERLNIGSRKTPIVIVSSRRTGARLGQIKWFGRWRQYCFWPDPGTIFNTGCMTDIQAKIRELHVERQRDRQVPSPARPKTFKKLVA